MSTSYRFASAVLLTITFISAAAAQVRPSIPAALPSSAAATKPASSALQSAYGRLPMYFEENAGQTDSQVRFIARGAGYALFIANDETVAVLQSSSAGAHPRTLGRGSVSSQPPAVVRMQLQGANKHPSVSDEDLLGGESNYFIGNDASKWRTHVAHYSKVRLNEVYPGIDVLYYGNQRQLEYDLVVRPGADPRQIRLQFKGADRIDVDPSGDLVLHVAGGELRQRLPVVYQEKDGIRQPVRAAYRQLGAGAFGVDLAGYDSKLPLVIDPAFVYSTYLGGSGTEIFTYGVAVDGSGNAYVTGTTTSTDFPTASPLQPTHGADSGAGDAFVTKFNASGSALVYSTYLGGSGTEAGDFLAVDGSGNAYVTGFTTSSNFPTVNALQPVHAADSGVGDAFVTKLNATGSALVYSTYLGGSGDDIGWGIAVDGSGAAYVSGATRSTDFPTANPLQAAHAADSGGVDVFVAKLNAAGSALTYSTYLGGSGDEVSFAIAVDVSGSAYVTGFTTSTNFPTASPLQATHGADSGSADAFVAKLNATGSALVYSTYLGGNAYEQGEGIAVDSSGNACVAGPTKSTNFPTASALQAGYAGSSGSAITGGDVFVTKLNATGSGFVYSTYLGGSGDEEAQGIAVDSWGNVYVTGLTDSTNFPTASPLQASNGGAFDAFVAVLNSSGSALIHATYLGGSGNDEGDGIAIDGAGNACVAGDTTSTNFPTASPLQASNAGATDAFIARLAFADMTIATTHTGTFQQLTTGTYTITARNIGPAATFGTVTVTDSLPPGVTATAISGTGWSCTLATLTCTRSDALATGASYSPITLTVSITATTAGTATNTAVVSGGAETVTSNDTSSDVATVGLNPAVPALDPRMLVALALLLATIGVVFLRR